VNERREVEAVLRAARERAEKRGTTVEQEIEYVAAERARKREARARRAAEYRSSHTREFLEVEKHLRAATTALRHVLAESEGVDFDIAPLPGDPTTYRGLLVHSLGRVRARINEVEQAITKRPES
jgi:hypothetical protein